MDDGKVDFCFKVFNYIVRGTSAVLAGFSLYRAIRLVMALVKETRTKKEVRKK